MLTKLIFIFVAIAAVLLEQAKTESKTGWSCKETGKQYPSKATAYYPSNDGVEGGFVDTKGNPLQSLQKFLNGNAKYVSVAMDKNLKIKYGTKICIPEINNHYKKYIDFQVVDTGSDFTGKKYIRIDICVQDKEHSKDEIVNGQVTLIFPA